MKITKKQIRDLDEGKTTVRELFPNMFEKFTGWAKDDRHPNWIAYFDKDEFKYGININGDWVTFSRYRYSEDSYNRPATHEEIESELKKEAIKRGFVEGAMVGCAKHPNIGYSRPFECLMFEDKVTLSNGHKSYIFYNGKWAKIIDQPKEMTVEQIQKELGHKIKIVE